MALRQQEHTQALAKLERLRERLRVIGGAVVAFSSGVDSTFLLRVAHEELGERVIAATIRSHTFPRPVRDEAVAFCRAEGVRHEVIDYEELDIPRLAARAAEIAAAFKDLGFAYVTLDLLGYRTGSMNETLPTAVTAYGNIS